MKAAFGVKALKLTCEVFLKIEFDCALILGLEFSLYLFKDKKVSD